MKREKNIQKSIETLDELVSALSEGERTTFGQILCSINTKKINFESMATWSDDSYTRNCLARTDDFELILLCWGPQQATSIHDHGGEECWVYIVDGKMEENIFKLKDNEGFEKIRTSVAQDGDLVYMIDKMGYHTLTNLSNERSMSLHLYAKPISSCHVYDESEAIVKKKELKYDSVYK